MTFRPPHSLTIGGRRVPVLVEDLGGNHGEYDANTKTIRVDRAVLGDRELLRAVLIHEAAHCALDLAGLTSYTSGSMTMKLEEQVVSVIENFIAPVIRRIARI